MKRDLYILILCCSFSISFTLDKKPKEITHWIAIDWVDELNDDFSFAEEWSYPPGIYKNKFGQLSCDGICPHEIEQMKDDKGKIDPDSLPAFYQIVDTTLLFHSIKSKAWTYEWAGTDFITFRKQPDNTILGQSSCNMATHSSLNIKIKNDSVTAWIELNSVTDLGKLSFPMIEGNIKIDKHLINQGVIKAEFDLIFENNLDKDRVVFWKGLIYSKIDE